MNIDRKRVLRASIHIAVVLAALGGVYLATRKTDAPATMAAGESHGKAAFRAIVAGSKFACANCFVDGPENHRCPLDIRLRRNATALPGHFEIVRPAKFAFRFPDQINRVSRFLPILRDKL